MALLTIPRTQVVYAMSLHNAPAARCASGDTLCFETLDCFGGQITSPDQRLGGLDWDHINPATGPLYVEGARPGDGEVVVCGVEIAGRVTVRVTVLRDCPLPTPFLVTERAFMTISSASALHDAAADATLRMREFLFRQVGLEEHDAGMVLSVAGDVRVCQMVDPQVTCRMEVPRTVSDAYGYAFP